ncbi:hypothetical protein AVEN_1188-1 [Araneus ventricosus]|uniref:Uncharacterized protein n=1 Tax=Araneus ventricosus TaxID=182803 RepID=A0A4Y2EE85_ARAVE|nr:hypothetical protein AVEN_1188-1 [Araneus ventricosus]
MGSFSARVPTVLENSLNFICRTQGHGNHHHHPHHPPRLPQQISLQQSNKLQHHMLTKSVRQEAKNSESGNHHHHPHTQQPQLPQQVSLQQSNKPQHHMLTKSVRQAANNSEPGRNKIIARHSYTVQPRKSGLLGGLEGPDSGNFRILDILLKPIEIVRHN